MTAYDNALRDLATRPLWPAGRGRLAVSGTNGHNYERRTLQRLVDDGHAEWVSMPGVMTHLRPVPPRDLAAEIQANEDALRAGKYRGGSVYLFRVRDDRLVGARVAKVEEPADAVVIARALATPGWTIEIDPEYGASGSLVSWNNETTGTPMRSA